MTGRAKGVALTLGLGFATAALVLSDLPARLLVAETPPARVDAALVLAGDPWYERTATAAAMVRSGEAYLLVVTGGERGPGDSAASLRDKAIELGVPPERIRMEAVSRSTWESLVAVAPILRREGVRSVALVTSPYHQRRSLLAARKALPGLELRCRPALPSSWSPRGWWRDPYARRAVFSEYGKLLYYLLSGRI
jgi:uncharacterized SAM-binding protein YcdF (DUF218 family)